MSMPTEAVEALHEATALLKHEHVDRDEWLKTYERDHETRSGELDQMFVNRAEAEQIFAQRIAAHEARLKELGWTRAVRVAPSEATS